MTARTFHSALKQPGKHLQLIREHTPGKRIRRYGHRYRVVVSRPQTEKVQQISGVSMVQRISGVSAKKVQQISDSLDLSLSPFSYEKVITPSSPADAAEDQSQDIGACQPLGKGQDLEDKTVTTVQDIGTLPANTIDPEPEAETTTQAPDVLPADTVVRLPADSDPEEQDVTAQDLDALPIDTTDPLPPDRAPEPEAETLTPGDDLDALPADTADLRPLDSEPEPLPETPAAADPSLPLPDRHNLIPADLRDLARLRVIYLQFMACGYLTRCEANWRHVVTAAVHALRVGKKPCALFYRIVTDQWWTHPEKWDFLSQADEDKARALMREQEPPPFMRDLRLVPKTPALSPDAELVAPFREVLAFTRYDGNLFHAFRSTDEGRGWDRSRFDAALAELATPTEPAGFSPAVTASDLPAWGSELAQIEPPIVAMGLPTPTEETSAEKPTEAATERENTGMVPSTTHQADVPTLLASHIASDDSSAFPPDPDVADVAGSGPWQEGPEATFWDQTWLKLDRIKTPLHGIPMSRLRYASEDDLRDDGFLVGLYEEALSMGHMHENEGGPLVFFAAAEHALYAGGVANRPWLFRTIVVRGKWNLVTYEAKDHARQRLAAMDSGRQSPGRGGRRGLR
jgi:hypothetical protein